MGQTSGRREAGVSPQVGTGRRLSPDKEPPMIAEPPETSSSDDLDYEKDRVAWNLPQLHAGSPAVRSRDHAEATEPESNGVSSGRVVPLRRGRNV
jgi:hypothetical protein